MSNEVIMQEMEDSEDADSSSFELLNSDEKNDGFLDDWYDTDTFSCLPNGGNKVITKDDPEYTDVKKSFDHLLQNISDPANTDHTHYKELIKMAFSLDDLNAIRKTFEICDNHFCYDESILLEWLYRELREYETTKDETILENIKNIFDTFLQEKYSFLIVCKFAQFAKLYPKPLDIWEQILSTYIYDFSGAPKFFKFWKDFHLNTEPESAEKYKKIVEMFKRLLSVPHLDMDKTYIDFKLLCTNETDKYEVNWEEIQNIYSNAQIQAETMIPYEMELDSIDDTGRSLLYKLYIAECSPYLDDEIVQFLYERMVSNCSKDASCWLDYIKYLQNNPSDNMKRDISKSWIYDQTVMDIINRALKLSEPSAQLVIEKMRLIEMEDFSKNEMTKIMETALLIPFDNPEPITSIWLEYLTILRRNMDITDEKEIDLLRKNFDLAWDSLSRRWGDLADCNGEILKFWGRLEYGPLNDPLKGKELWSTVMSYGDNSSKSAIWIEFINLELQKSINGARKLYRRAASTSELYDPEVIIAAWIRFERCHGTYDQLKSCQEFCHQIMLQYQEQQTLHNQEHQEERSKKTLKRKADKHKQTDKEFKYFKSSQSKPDKNLKRKIPEDSAVDFKRQKLNTKTPPLPDGKNISDNSNERDPAKDNVTIFLSNLDYNLNEEDIKVAFPELKIKNIDLVRAVGSGRNRGFCYVELDSELEVNEALKFDRRPINGRPTYISSCLREKTQRAKFKYAETLEKTKLFIKGCSNATKEELEELFKPFGVLKDIRIVYHKSGSPKGIAYIEYEKETAATAAILKMDQYQLRDHTLTVALSAPPPRNTPSTSVNKIISLGEAKRSANRGEMKPRMSFIPRSVLKKVEKAEN